MGEAAMEMSGSLLERWQDYVTGLAPDDRIRLQGLDDRLATDSDGLMSVGLDADEAFVIALKRVSGEDPIPRAFIQEHVGALWPVPAVAVAGATAKGGFTKGFKVMLGCAVGAGLTIKVPALFGIGFSGAEADVYLANLSLFVLPFLLVFYAWAHRPTRQQLAAISAILVAGAVFANVYPFVIGSHTQALTAIHLPIALWLVLGVAATGGDWLSIHRRMEYTKFTGEWFITYVLIALGGGVLSVMTVGLFEAIGINTEVFVSEWMIPCGAVGAVVVAAWLVESRRRLIGGIAPMLAGVFTPLFAGMLAALLVGVVLSNGFIDIDREVLIFFDLLLVVVVAMLLYAQSARDRMAPPGLFDYIQLVLVASAFAVDVFALANITVRLGQFGFSPNRVAALGLNLIMLVNLVRSAYLQVGFLRSKRTFAEVESWQMHYLPVYAAWAAIVVVLFPPLFGFM